MSMSDDQINRVFESLGRIEQKIDGHATVLTQHIADDKEIAKLVFPRINALEMAHASQRGGTKVWAMVATGAGAVVGTLAPVLVAWLRHRP